MSHPIASSSLRIHTNTHLSFYEQIKNCFDPIVQCVIKIFKQIGDFFYKLFHTNSKNKPAQVVQDVNPVRVPEPIRPIAVPGPKNILAFYKGEEPNVDGLTIHDIINADDDFLEKNHAWVQWAFPLEKPSAFNPTAPVLDKATIAAMRYEVGALFTINILKVFVRVLHFYGLTYADGKILRADNFAQAAKNWLTPGNHNFLRITRIIHSLGLMRGQPNINGKSFFDIMEDIYLHEGKGIISEKTYEIWKNAV